MFMYKESLFLWKISEPCFEISNDLERVQVSPWFAKGKLILVESSYILLVTSTSSSSFLPGATLRKNK